jgi:GrpB-like predicted nucleotidyltransferase (UPF0157 family)
MTESARYRVRGSLKARLSAWSEALRVPFTWEPKRSLSILATATGLGAALPFAGALPGLAVGLTILYWTRRDLVLAMERLNRLDLPPLHLEAWSPQWDEQVALERDRIDAALAPFSSALRSGLVHIGSTSVRSMQAAKPIHDVAILIESDETPSRLIEAFRSLDYFVIGTPPHAPDGGDTWLLWFPKDEAERAERGSGFALHIVGPSGRARVEGMVVHSRFLSAHPDEAAAYSSAKQEASRLQNAPAPGEQPGYRIYTEAKAGFVVAQRKRADAWYAAHHGKPDLERDYPPLGGTNADTTSARHATAPAK